MSKKIELPFHFRHATWRIMETIITTGKNALYGVPGHYSKLNILMLKQNSYSVLVEHDSIAATMYLDNALL